MRGEVPTARRRERREPPLVGAVGSQCKRYKEEGQQPLKALVQPLPKPVRRPGQRSHRRDGRSDWSCRRGGIRAGIQACADSRRSSPYAGRTCVAGHAAADPPPLRIPDARTVTVPEPDVHPPGRAGSPICRSPSVHTGARRVGGRGFTSPRSRGAAGKIRGCGRPVDQFEGLSQLPLQVRRAPARFRMPPVLRMTGGTRAGTGLRRAGRVRSVGAGRPPAGSCPEGGAAPPRPNVAGPGPAVVRTLCKPGNVTGSRRVRW